MNNGKCYMTIKIDLEKAPMIGSIGLKDTWNEVGLSSNFIEIIVECCLLL